MSIGFLVNGKWITDGEALQVVSPFDGALAGTTFQASARYLEEATQAALRAFEVTRRLPGYERQRALVSISEGIAARREGFARTMVGEAGKPLKAARTEVDRAAFTFRVAAEESVRIGGEWLPLDSQRGWEGRSAILRRFPLGPIAAITPFNFPLNLVAHKIAPAMAAGCSMVLKPAPKTPLCALMLAEIVQEAGWPAGALNVLCLLNQDAETMASDDRFKLLTFTGSDAVGWMLKAKAGKKRVALELGGNAAVIVHSDADVAKAAEKCVAGGFSYAGQSCISVQRIYVHRSVEEKFVKALLDGVIKLKVGNPLDEETDVGPMINEAAAQRSEEWVQEARKDGARLLAGGKREGSLFYPTVLANARPDMRVVCEEVFAPVVVVEGYDDFSDVLRAVNDSRYGLQAGLFTNDTRCIQEAYEKLEVGGLIVNDSSAFRADQMPYGGLKDSGLGREGLRSAIGEMTEAKLLVMNEG
jgi:acyl-CoA reductase-like NAD-dependent aldehyde dehydrogenase